MLKREGKTVLKRVSAVLCRFKYSLGSDLLLLMVLYCKRLFHNNTYHNAKVIIGSMLTNWTDK